MSREKPTIKSKILQYLKNQGVSKNKFYENSGISRGTLDTDSELTEGSIRKFLAYAPEVNTEWLFGFNSPWYKKDVEQHYRDLFANEEKPTYNAVHRDKPTECRELSQEQDTLTVRLELDSVKKLETRLNELELRINKLEKDE